jgi:hypothetical protein
MVAAVLISWLLDRATLVNELARRREAVKAFGAHRDAMKAELQAMKDWKSLFEPQSSGGMFGNGPKPIEP